MSDPVEVGGAEQGGSRCAAIAQTWKRGRGAQPSSTTKHHSEHLATTPPGPARDA